MPFTVVSLLNECSAKWRADCKGELAKVSAFFQEMFRVGVYKRSQGRVCRQVTFAVIAIVVVLGAFRLGQTLGSSYGVGVSHGVSGVTLLLGLWIGYRMVNVPTFADFLISVEAEVNKVSWPTRHELFRGSVVVLITIIGLAAVLFGFDTFWKALFKFLGVV